MANKDLQLQRGLQADLPTGISGEPLWTTDTKRLYLGDGVTNNLIQGASTLLTTGVIPFADSNGKLTMDASNLVWDNTNNRLGIGTASPSTGLHAKIDAFRLAHPSYASYYFDMDNNGGTVNMNAVGTGSYYLWKENGSSKMILDASGNLGIGTTGPGYKLEVTGKIAALETVGGATDTQLLLGTTVNWFNIGRIVSTGALSIQGTQTGNNNILLAPTSGNVGIGTTSPGYKLDIIDTTSGVSTIRINNTTTGGLAYISKGGTGIGAFGSSGTWLNNSSTDFVVASYSGQNIRFFVNGNSTESMRLDTTGNVGIGTTSPNEKLEVSGNTLISNNNFYKAKSLAGTKYSLAGITSGNIVQIGAIDYTTAGTTFAGGDNSQFTTGGASGDVRMSIINNGNVGIGTTTPSNALDVVSSATYTTIGITNIGAGGASAFTLNNTANQTGNRNWGFTSNDIAWGDFTFKQSNVQGGNPLTAGTSRLYISPTGNVGIGTTAPSYPLSVASPVASAGSNVVVGYFEGNGTSNDNTSIVRIITSAGTGTYTDIEQNAGGGAASFRGGSSYYDTNIFNSRRSSSDTYGNINFITGNAASSTIAMTIGAGTQKGNVGIGTTSPAYKLDVQGDIGLGASSSTTAHLYMNSTTRNQIIAASGASLEFWDGATENGRIDGAGNFMLGTTDSVNSGSKIKVAGGVVQIANSVGTDNVALNKGITMGSAVSDSSSFFNVGSGSGWKMLFTTGGASSYDSSRVRMSIMDGGVRIGASTSAPTAPLTIGDNVTSTTSSLYFYMSTSDTLTHTQNTLGNSQVVGVQNNTLYYDGTASYGNARLINNTGYVTNTSGSNIIRGAYNSIRTTSGGAGNTLIANTGEVILSGTGNVTNAIAHEVSLYQDGAKTTTNLYGIKVLDLTNSAGTITNTYGIYTGDLTTGTQTNTAYNIYLSDANAKNYFAGETTFNDKVINTSTVRLKGYTVAGLPTGTTGDTAYVTNALAPTFGATVVGGGAVTIPVFYDGANWIVY